MTRKEMTKMTQGPRPRCTASLGASTLGAVLTTVAVDRTALALSGSADDEKGKSADAGGAGLAELDWTTQTSLTDFP